MRKHEYSGAQGRCAWQGESLDAQELAAIKDALRERMFDLSNEAGIEDHLRDLADTGLSAAWIETVLSEAAAVPVHDWQVGEALAEALLEAHHHVVFPSNTRRDERNPYSSLPGADLVGLSLRHGVAMLVFGEVKSSADTTRPPGVVYGKSGLTKQLERYLDDDAIRVTLIKYLSGRAEGTAAEEAFETALASWVRTRGAAVRLIGVLMRDTTPDETDVRSRGHHLGGLAPDECDVELVAWYLPLQMSDWISLVAA